MTIPSAWLHQLASSRLSNDELGKCIRLASQYLGTALTPDWPLLRKLHGDAIVQQVAPLLERGV
jgi:hypothetical protein